ncbi:MULTISPECIES: stalk domain-containing protein [Anoxybacillus]|uniref:Copper amine oxidase N-terminal domain-containing protein n=1 Tax=Anoxybacillus flavithermus TaxID=33934 RepID=A0AAX2A5T7_9BACL|nr:copper amine oxidase N-terminal domain-containing protein [Anoxybacillus flavithermus]MBE2904899.1 copper amine oxidase N-terminal domain-containing protein [Anoxybacillus flavithermus]MBE2908982.1 copper amine oxidase N-terminal domain-containing protein [Anoxybacillus flavithermus]MBE2911064.1 copper amine oxidase N-terminal domain-containing protein [Anoxybacillus flavithermus]MBE2916344.1 copper amine oxidase N-terminal domain-containing protein [Anoxybacillus flavithermus]MBE2917590.1 
MVVLFKKMITYVLVAFISFLTMATSAEATNVRTVRIPIISNGKVLQTDTSPIMVNNRILVPFRAIAQSTGANVFWNANTKQVTVQKNKKVIFLTVQSSTATINDQTVTLDAPPIIYKGRTLVPIRFIAEALDANVQWTGKEVRLSWSTLQTSAGAVYVNETKITNNAMTDGVYTYLPLKKLLTAIDVNVDWIETDETMRIRLSRGQMTITAGKKQLVVDDHEIVAPLAPIRLNDEWYVSASWVMTVFGAQMTRNGNNDLYFSIPRTTFRSPLLPITEAPITVPQHVTTPSMADGRRLLISDNPEVLTATTVPLGQATLALDDVQGSFQAMDHRVFGWHVNNLGTRVTVAMIIDNRSANDIIVTNIKGTYRTSPNSWGYYDVGLPLAEAILRQSLATAQAVEVKAGTSAVIQAFDVSNNQLLGFLYDFTVQQESGIANYRIRTVVTSAAANFSTISPTLAPIDSYATHPRGVWKGTTLEATLPTYTIDGEPVAYSISNGKTDHLLSVANALSHPSETVHNPGHYGLTYRLSLPIQNETGEIKTIRLRFSGRGGAYCGAVKINGVVYLIPPLQPITQSAYIDYTVFSNQDVLSLELMHAGGAALPLGVEVSTVK